MSLTKHYKHLEVKVQDVKNATKNFSEDHLIGGGGFGEVYQGKLAFRQQESTVVAFKRLNRTHGQGEREFWNEIVMLSHYRHKNIVSLLGFCEDRDERILVYEYVSRKGLDLYLNADDLTWFQRLTICIGAANGLAYLHSDVGTNQRVFHRDVKSANILLDKNWNAKISDFGLSKFGSTNKDFSVVYTTAVGTMGYCDPLYVQTGNLTKESDVYSFGVVLFEVLCGRPCIIDYNKPGEALTRLVEKSYGTRKLNDIIFDKLRNKITPESMNEFTKIAYQCLRLDRLQRPSMEEVVKALQNALEYQFSPDKAYNHQTILAQREIQLSRIFNAVLALDSFSIDAAKIHDLIKLLPTSEEREMLKSYRGDKEILGERCQFVLECMKIPNIETKLRVFAFTITFSSQVKKITEDLNIIKEATKEIKESKKLKSIMKKYDELLAHTHKGHLDERWFNDIQFPKETDIFLLYKEAEEQMLDCFDFYNDMIHLDVASKIQIQDVRKSKSAILKEVEEAQQEFNASANDGSVSAGFREALKTFLDSTNLHPLLTDFFDEVIKDADSVVTLFGADPKHQTWTNVLGLLGQFIEMFKKQDDVLKRERAEIEEAERKRQAVADHKRRYKEFATKPAALRMFVMMVVALSKIFDFSFKPEQDPDFLDY